MKKTLFFLTLLSIASLSAQTKIAPNYNAIKENVSNEKSSYFYPVLLQKYFSMNNTLTLEEKRHLYYGFVFQSWSHPNTTTHEEKEIKKVVMKKFITKTEYRDVVQLANIVLKTNPFNTYALQWKIIALFKLDQSNSVEYDQTTTQYSIVMDAIMSSGNGRSKESAYWVISVQHEYELLNYLDYKPSGQEEKTVGEQYYDYITLTENGDKIAGFYFEITPAHLHLKAMLEQQKSKKNSKNK
jgi:hypothetical protein